MKRPPASEEIYQRIGRNVAEQRRKAGLSQTELAERCDRTRGSISNIESGKQRVTLHTLSDIAEVLEVDMRSLLPAPEADREGEEGASDAFANAPGWLREKPLAFLIDSLLAPGVLTRTARSEYAQFQHCEEDADTVEEVAVRELDPKRRAAMARALSRIMRSSSLEDAGAPPPIPTEELEEKAGSLLLEAGMTSIPVPVDNVAEYLGVKVAEEDLGEECSGMLVQHRDFSVIGVNANHHEHRKRFTIAHEIGHYMLHSRAAEEVYIDSPPHVGFRAADPGSGTEQEENEANRFAAALLMPAWQVRAAVAEQRVDPAEEDEILDLARRFRVSPQAMTKRLIHLELTSGD